MKSTRRLIWLIMVSVFIFWQCDKEPGEKEPDCEVVCNINTEEYSINITCESGSTTTTYNNESTEYHYDNNGQLSGITKHLSQTRTYENTKNTYQIVGVIDVDLKQNTVTYNITVSGGVFTEPQTCSGTN